MRFGSRIAAAILLLLSASCSKDPDKDPGGDPDGGPMIGGYGDALGGMYDADNVCFECFNAKCPDESKACGYACGVVGCLNECRGPDGGGADGGAPLTKCASSCVADAGDISDAASEIAEILTCLKANCASECGL